MYTCARVGGLAIIPYRNMISNIGLTGAHANGNKSAFHEMPVAPLDVHNLVHPARVSLDTTMNIKIYNNVFSVIRPYHSTMSKIRYALGAGLRFVGLRE